MGLRFGTVKAATRKAAKKTMRVLRDGNQVARWAVAASIVGLVSLMSSVHAQQPAVTPQTRFVAAVLAHVERLTGRQPLNCGIHLLTRVGRGLTNNFDGLVPAPETALRRSLACGVKAAAARTPFFTFRERQEYLTLLAEGLIGGRDGAIQQFQYDSAPIDGGEARFSVASCDGPSVTLDDVRRDYKFRCKER